MSRRKTKRRVKIPFNELDKLKTEPGAEELAQSPVMEPYVRLATAAIQGQDLKAALDEIAALPLEKRYVWRVVSALKWAFTDYDSLGIAADRETLSPEDRIKVTDFLEFRPVQFCLFLKSLLGDGEMERMMTSAIAHAKQSATMRLG